jgi:hypothetical protein
MLFKLIKTVLFVALCVASSAQGVEYQWIGSVGYDSGGDRVLQGTYTNGITEGIYAGQGYAVNLGAVIYNNPQHTTETQVTIGYKFGGPIGTNGYTNWYAMPIEVLQFYRPWQDIRAGAGLSYQTDVHIKSDVDKIVQVINFKPALGLLLDVGYTPPKAPYSMDLRYLKIKQKLKDSDQSFDGSLIGAYFQYRY